jgi:hypothetical protein
MSINTEATLIIAKQNIAGLLERERALYARFALQMVSGQTLPS